MATTLNYARWDRLDVSDDDDDDDDRAGAHAAPTARPRANAREPFVAITGPWDTFSGMQPVPARPLAGGSARPLKAPAQGARSRRPLKRTDAFLHTFLQRSCAGHWNATAGASASSRGRTAFSMPR